MVKTLSQARLPRDRDRFPDAETELTGEQIENRYGAYIRATVPKLAHPDYLVEMAHAAASILKHRARTAAAKG